MTGTLYIVATPIGHLGDITSRAIETLRTVDIICAEDTRHSRHLLTHFGIQKKLLSYFEYSKKSRADTIYGYLEEGKNVGYVSDAGTPCISDPGARLVAGAYQRGISVVPIPGPCAWITALSISGMPTEPCHFWGFLSPSRSKRRKVYKMISELEGSHGFYQSPHKIEKYFQEWEEYFQDYYFFVAKEMTKKFEMFFRGKLSDVCAQMHNIPIKGEYTVIISQTIF